MRIHKGTLLVCAFLAIKTLCAFGQETHRQYLSGLGKEDPVPWKFFCSSGTQSGYWTNLPVPSCWELHGFGTLSYQFDPTNAPEQGRYEHVFSVPANWSGQRVFLVFDGSMTDTRAWVNGESVGPVHQGSFYRFKYEITKLAQFGATNRLEVTVDKRSANASVNRAERTGDYWLFGGIFRPVFLEAVPQQFIERVAVDARADGAFAMDVFVNGAVTNLTLEAQITDLDGKAIGGTLVQALTGQKGSLKTQIAAPRTWSAETPNLYQAQVYLKNGDRVLHHFQQQFGFRTMEVREGDGLYVNGQRVILKGASRHSFWPDSGRTLDEKIHRLDISLMQEMNMNAVRMSHYPPDEQFLDLCDQLGLYVLDELGGWQKSYDTETGHKLIEEMVVRDVNHPSILFWDNGNEGGWNRAVDGDFALWDPQGRKVLHPTEPFNGVNTTHYPTYSRIQSFARGEPLVQKQGGVTTTNLTKFIVMPTEFLHGLYDGGAGAGLEEYWTTMLRSKLLGGGFIWSLLDEGVKRADNGTIDVAGNRAPDGILGPYREKEGSFYTIKEIWSPIVISERRLPPGFSGALTVENRYSFLNASQCQFHWQLRKFRRPEEKAAGFTVVAEGQSPAPDIQPGSRGALKLDLPADWDKADALSLIVKNPTGRELWTWVWPLPATERFHELSISPSSQSAALIETPGTLDIKAGDLTIQISKTTGRLVSAKRGARNFSLTNGPSLAASGKADLVAIEHKADGKDQIVTATFSGDLKSITWRARGNGWVQCDYVYSAEGPKSFIGVVFDYPEQEVKHKKWLGQGPYRVWQNRLCGATLNVWENDYNNTITGWEGWVYPEFKGCFAEVRWMQLETTEGTITALAGKDDLFVQVLTPDFPPTKLQANTALSLPKAGLAFLNAIPPMGSKFHAPKDTGPQGQLFQASGQYSGSLNFYFGTLPH
jgi:hypothetical protein